MIGLTAKQMELLRFLCAYMDASGGIAPSFMEIQQAMGLSAKSGVHRLLGGLEYRGMIRRLEYRHRAIEIIKRPDEYNIPLSMVSAGDMIDELRNRKLSPKQRASLRALSDGS